MAGKRPSYTGAGSIHRVAFLECLAPVDRRARRSEACVMNEHRIGSPRPAANGQGAAAGSSVPCPVPCALKNRVLMAAIVSYVWLPAIVSAGIHAAAMPPCSGHVYLCLLRCPWALWTDAS
eukprot:COSAG06_NODE_2688_length_6445_cov_4.638526_1_plen_121_part_00